MSDEYHESIQAQQRRAFFEEVEEEQQIIIEALKAAVSTWTENEIDAGNTPTLEGFCDQYSEWDHDALYDIIEAEMGRVARLCQN
jgi:hypothetical protein